MTSLLLGLLIHVGVTQVHQLEREKPVRSWLPRISYHLYLKQPKEKNTPNVLTKWIKNSLTSMLASLTQRDAKTRLETVQTSLNSPPQEKY